MMATKRIGQKNRAVHHGQEFAVCQVSVRKLNSSILRARVKIYVLQDHEHHPVHVHTHAHGHILEHRVRAVVVPPPITVARVEAAVAVDLVRIHVHAVELPHRVAVDRPKVVCIPH